MLDKQFTNKVEAALFWFRFGFKVIPIIPDTKSTAVKWDEWLDRLSPEKIAEYWKKHPKHEIGFIVGEDIIVFDADSPESIDALAELEARFGVKPMLVVKTAKGKHHYYRRAKGIFAKSDAHSTSEYPERIDVKTGRSMVILPPSTGKVILQQDATNASELTEVDQAFIDAVYQHNGREAPNQLVPVSPMSVHSEPQSQVIAKLKALLAHIDPDCGYSIWLQVLMAIFQETGGSEEGLRLAIEWSGKGKKFKGSSEIKAKWRSFRLDVNNPITIATLIKQVSDSGKDWVSICAEVEPDFVALDSETKVIYPSKQSEVQSKDSGNSLSVSSENIDKETVARSASESTKQLNKSINSGNIGTSSQKKTASVSSDPDADIEKSPRTSGDVKTHKTANISTLDKAKPLSADSFPDRTREGNLVATIPNLKHLLKSYGINVRYNTIKKKLMITIPGHSGTADNADNVKLTSINSLATLNSIAIGQVPSYLEAIGDQNQYNPVAAWITSKPWDGKDRLVAICDTLVEREGYPKALKQILVYRWLLSAVAAALKPNGFKARGVLTLQGPQGIGKTSWISALVPESLLREEVVKLDHHLDAGNKDSIITAVSHWIVEIGELDSSFRKDIARLKGFLTSDYDKVRRPYGKTDSEYPRRTVFCATVNENDFLVDPTGNSRWWTIPIVKINYQHGIDMQQVFAQLAVEYEEGAQWWLTQEEEKLLEQQNKDHRAISVIRERVLDMIDLDRINEGNLPAMAPIELLLEIGINHPTNQQCKECASLLRELFGEPKKIKGHNKWRVPLKVDKLNDKLFGKTPGTQSNDEDKF